MERVSVVRAHDLLVLSMNHVLPVTSDSRVEWGGEMQYGLWRLLSERKTNDKTVRPKLPLWEHFLIVSFQRNFFMLQTCFVLLDFAAHVGIFFEGKLLPSPSVSSSPSNTRTDP